MCGFARVHTQAVAADVPLPCGPYFPPQPTVSYLQSIPYYRCLACLARLACLACLACLTALLCPPLHPVRGLPSAFISSAVEDDLVSGSDGIRMPPRLPLSHRPDVLLLNCFHVTGVSSASSQFVLQVPLVATVRELQEVCSPHSSSVARLCRPFPSPHCSRCRVCVCVRARLLLKPVALSFRLWRWPTHPPTHPPPPPAPPWGMAR